jgi:small subunit ribosomal protein S7
MSRRREAAKRPVLQDPKFHSELVTKFINHVMMHGKKSIAEQIVYGALDIVNEKIKGKPQEEVESGGESGSRGYKGPVDLLDHALDNVRPTVEVRPRRVGGATYQVPIEVPRARSDALAMRWLVQSSRERNEKDMTNRLAFEIIDAIGGKGESIKKRENMHRMAKANQAFAHFRWN